MHLRRTLPCLLLALALAGCAPDPAALDTGDAPATARDALTVGGDSAGGEIQGGEIQGGEIQGGEIQGGEIQGGEIQGGEIQGATPNGEVLAFHALTGWRLDGARLDAPRLEGGQLVADRDVPASGSTASLGPCTSREHGLRRACGWRVVGVGACTPGLEVRVSAAACGGGSCTGDPVLRACSGTAPCEHTGAALLDASNDACGSTCPQVSFRCPASGRYTVMTASHDSAQASSVRLAASTGTFPLRETLRGAQLVGLELPAALTGGGVLRHRVTSAAPSPEAADAWLYGVEQRQADGTWAPWCAADHQGRRAALPVGALFDGRGDRVESTSHFTFGCTAGAVAKCVRWGYRPWAAHPAGPDALRELHAACTRMARADYCGDGTAHTRNGTRINIWDTLAPTPVQERGTPGLDMLFEAGWTPAGAACLSKQRWLTLPLAVAAACPDRLVAPGLGVLGATVCDSPYDAALLAPGARLFNESQLNLDLLP